MKRSLFLLAAALPALAGAPGSAQTRDEGDLQTLTVLRVDPAANEIVVRETGSTRNRTLELDERTAVFGGALGGRMTLQDLEPGDTIRVPGVAGSVSDRVRAEEIQILTTPRDPGAAAPGMRRSDDRPGQRPSAMDPPDGDPGALGRDPIGQPGALGRDPIDQPGALGDDPGTAPDALGTDGRTEPGRVGADPGASDQDSRGTGSPTTPRPRPGDAGTGGGGSGGRGGSSSGGSGGSGGGSGGSGGGGGGR